MSFTVYNDEKENLGIKSRKPRSKSVEPTSRGLQEVSNVPEQLKKKYERSNLVPSWSLDKDPRGTCEIFNFKEFDQRPDLTREGTDIDAANLKNTFDYYLRIPATIHQNMTKKAVFDRLEEFTNDPQTEDPEIGIAVLVFLSHGEINGSNTITTSDNRIIYVETEILPLFTAEKCPALAFIPKLFIIQACRGEKLNVIGDTVKTEALPFNRVKKELSIQEACVINATLPFYVALRHEATGSIFINVLCDTLRNHADHAEFKELMLIVSKRIVEMKADVIIDEEIVPNVRSVPEERYIGWTRSLYLGTDTKVGSDPPKGHNF